MRYLVRVNGCVVGIQILTIEEVKKYNNIAEIKIEKIS